MTVLAHRFREPSVIPGFGITLGVTLAALGLVVLIPLSALFLKAAGLGFSGFIATAFDSRAMAAYGLSFGAALVAALVNLFFGTLVAWVLVRYRFAGKRLLDALIDLPFALPTAVAGIALTTLFAPNGAFGAFLEPLGIKVAFTRLGVILAMIFIGLPFVVRSVQPVLEDLESEVEEAAASLGASRLQTLWLVVLPSLLPALISGFALAFVRAVGEYGSIIFIAGNMPGQTEIAPLLIIIKLEQYNYAGATAIASVMLIISFVLLFVINRLQHWRQSRMEGR
ncbi:MAG: sulfate ABC transporter permease subunit CysT [Alphaproteobacteria bacterium]|nr:sulfate ABC transporter permease subunit CysT [Alphaproteobacteria bacterium]